MTDPQTETHDRRPLLPVRSFGLNTWFNTRWSLFSRRYNPVSPAATDGEPSTPSDRSDAEGGPTVAPGSNPDPDSAVAEVTSVEVREFPEERPAESSLMATEDRSSDSATQRLLEAARRGSESLSGGSPHEKICLICLEPLSQEDFANGEAMVLQCQCKGDTALRHKECAQKWVDVKGDLTCDVCRSPITNLNAPQPRSDDDSHNPSDDPSEGTRGRYPSATDVFDCIRMTWVVTIVCILFFDLTIANALVTGLLIAVMYTWSCQLLRCAQYQVEGHQHQQSHENNANTEAANEHPAPAIVIV